MEYSLLFLSTDPMEYIYDVYGRQGRLLLCEKYVVFQPLEVLNERASVFERKIPLANYPTHVSLPATTTTTSIKTTRATIGGVVNKLQEFLSKINAELMEEDMEEEVEKNWIYYAQRAKPMALQYIKEEEWNTYLIHHWLDELSWEEKKVIMTQPISSSIEIQKAVDKYIVDRSMLAKNGTTKWLILYDQGNFHFLVGEEKWKESTIQSFRTDVDEKKWNKWKPIVFQTHPIGYMSLDKKDIVFKVITNAKSKGVNMFNNYASDLVFATYNEYVHYIWPHKKLYEEDDKKIISSKILVVLLEIFMRTHKHCDSLEKKHFIAFL
jgi:hypothetical protein